MRKCWANAVLFLLKMWKDCSRQETILADIEAGNFSFEVALEDIHMNIEARLTERIGVAGARLHTARSRNDQVALDMHMYMKREIVEIGELLLQFEKALLAVAKNMTER